MDTVETSTPTEPTAPSETESLADHEQQFSQPKPFAPPPKDDAEPERPRERHRAQSQKAAPEDVHEIAALTKTLREKEAELVKAKPEAGGGSSRVLNLRRQIRGLEAELSDLTPKAAPVSQPATAPVPASETPSAFTEPEPVLDQFLDQPDPYAAWTRAAAKWDRRKEAFDSQQLQAQTQVSQHQQAEIAAHGTRMSVFAQATPDFPAKFHAMMQEVGGRVPDVLGAAVIRDDNGPKLLYALASDPVFRDEMVLLSEGKPLNDTTVALLQRRLRAQVSKQSAASTGSALLNVPTPPKPPNPVRTGAIRAEPELPGDDAPLSEHERAFSRRKRV